MRVTQTDPPATHGYVIVNRDDPHQIGLYFPEDRSEGVTIFWHGAVAKEHLVSILRLAEQGWRSRSGALKETLFFYGKEKETVGIPKQDMPAGASVMSGKTFDACRAELCNSRGKFILWANVVPSDISAPLELGGENIGISFPVRLFDTTARSIVSFAIQQTLPLGSEATDRLLGQVHQRLHSSPAFV
jgi:hypothetical protein